jgi:hypothetical protein
MWGPEDPGSVGHIEGTASAAVQLFQIDPVALADPSPRLQVRNSLYGMQLTALIAYRRTPSDKTSIR